MSKSIKTNAELYEIDNQLKKLEEHYKSVDNEISSLMKLRDKLNQRIINIRQRKSSLNENKELRISEHAVRRYIERVMHIDLADVEKELLSDSIKNTVRQLGGSCEIKKKGFKIIIKDFIITTIVKD